MMIDVNMEGSLFFILECNLDSEVLRVFSGICHA